MNKSCFITTILVLTTLSAAPIFGMTDNKQSTLDLIRSIPDIYNQITSKLNQKDLADTRLVCKKWACKNPNWYFMPNSVERKYDQIVKQKSALLSTATYKKLILFSLAAEKDFKGVQWIMNSQYIDDELALHNWLTNKCVISASMIAIHNKDYEMTRLLFESNEKSKYQCWKTYYKVATVPQEIEQCLYPSHNRDFSFLLYLSAVWLDNARTLKKLYLKKKPTPLGQMILINNCLTTNAKKCFKELLKHKDIKKITLKYGTTLFITAINTHQEDLAQILLKNESFHLNWMVQMDEYTRQNECTILDHYYHDQKLKDDYKAIELLLHLGAKRWVDISKS